VEHQPGRGNIQYKRGAKAIKVVFTSVSQPLTLTSDVEARTRIPHYDHSVQLLMPHLRPCEIKKHNSIEYMDMGQDGCYCACALWVTQCMTIPNDRRWQVKPPSPFPKFLGELRCTSCQLHASTLQADTYPTLFQVWPLGLGCRRGAYTFPPLASTSEHGCFKKSCPRTRGGIGKSP